MAGKTPIAFLHDANARNDERSAVLICKCGYEGYGIYWALIEMMRESSKLRLDARKLASIAHSLNAPFAVVSGTVDCGFEAELFHQEDEHFFYSRSLRRRLSNYHEISEKRRNAGLASAEARKSKYGTSAPILYPNTAKNERVFKGCSSAREQSFKHRSSEPRTPFEHPQVKLSERGGTGGGESITVGEGALSFAKAAGLGEAAMEQIRASMTKPAAQPETIVASDGSSGKVEEK